MKKLLALCLTVLLVVAMVPVFAVSADATPTIKVSEVEGAIGETVDVKVSLENNTGIISAKLKIAYDANVLELTAKTPGAAFAKEMKFSQTLDKNPYICNWVDSVNPNVTESDFVTLTFKVKDTAAVGKTEITVTYDPDDFFDVNYDNVTFAIDNGAVNVKCKTHNEVVEGAKEATCKEEGSTGTTKCSICGVVIKNAQPIAKKAHTEVVEGAKEATCKEEGSTGTTKCSVCGDVIKTAQPIAKKAHTEVVEGAKEATCKEEGSTGTTKCSVCGDVIKAAEVIGKKAHTEVVVGAKEATCEAAGYTGDKKCSVCGELIEAGQEIAQLSHNWVAVEKVDATCAAEGKEAHYACDAGCGKLAKDEAGAELVEAADLVIAKLAHKISKVDGVAATEDKAGVKEHYECSECKQLFADAEGKTVVKAEDTVIPKIEKAPENSDTNDKAPATGDVVVFFAMATMLIAAAAVVVLKKKA